MLAGYTSYEPTRELTARERATIAVAGPLAEIIPGLLALTAMGVNPFDHDAIRASDAALAIWWAGPVLGVVNLLPLLPLDGGWSWPPWPSRPCRVAGIVASSGPVWPSLRS